MTTMRDALESAMHHANPDAALSALQAEGIVVASQDTVSQAIHDVYCGIMADHEHPNDKDREQAQQLVAALGKLSGA
jgi:hypothetical protein